MVIVTSIILSSPSVRVSNHVIKSITLTITILSTSWEGPPRHVNNFAVLRAIYMKLAPIDSACKRAFYI